MTPTPPADTGPGLNAWYRRLEAATDPEHATVLERAAGPPGGAPSVGEPDAGGPSVGESHPPWRWVKAGGRPRTRIGTYGDITTRPHVTRAGTRYRAYTRYRDVDGRLRPVTCTARTAALAKAELKRRFVERAGYGSGALLSQASAFTDLTAPWLTDLAPQDLAEGTKKNYREALRQVEPVFEHYTLGEFTTGRIERFLREEHGRSYSRAKHARTILNLLFGFVLRHDAIPRNPLEGTSRL